MSPRRAPASARLYERAYSTTCGRCATTPSTHTRAPATTSTKSSARSSACSRRVPLPAASLRPDPLPPLRAALGPYERPARRPGLAAGRQSPQRDARSGFRVLIVARAVAVVIESRDLFRVEARGVPPDGVGALLVRMLCVPDQVSLGHVEALRFALAGLDQRRDRGVHVVVGILGPSRHVLRLLQPFPLSIARANRLRASAVHVARLGQPSTHTP